MSTTRSLLLVAVSVGLALFGASCSTTTEPEGAKAAPTEAVAPAALVGPERFAERIAEDGVVTINVHVPDEGTISGTDLTIPFDEIATSNALPTDRSTALAVYCRSGNMSADAVRDLTAMGFTNIVELEGGFNAWTAAGRPLEPAPA